MKLSVKSHVLSGTALILAAVIFLVLNVTSGVLFKALRWDLTKDKLYTLSPGSKQIIEALPEPVILRLYFSKNLARVNPYLVSFAARVEDLLVQYARASKGKIIVEIIDPEPFSPAEDEALSFGLQGMPLDSAGNDLFLGLVGTNSLDMKLVIPFIQPAREVNLEYDISQLIYKLANPQPITIGVMSALPIDGGMQRPWMVWQQMQQQFDLEVLDIDAQQIPSKIKTLMLVNPSKFAPAALQAIDQFVLRGGRILAFIDPLVEVTEGQEPASTDEQFTSFNTLLSAWGVKFNPNQVVADRSFAKQVLIQDQNRDQSIAYPLWMELNSDTLNHEDVLTSALERITLASPGALYKDETSKSTFTPLITSSDQSMLVSSTEAREVQQDIPNFLSSYKPSGSYVLAARISGPVRSAYSDAQVTDSNIVIVADVDMLHDHFWVKVQNVMGQEFGVPNSGNGNFVLSTLDNLAGSNALISIRNRGSFLRPFDRLQKLQLKSQEKYLATEQVLQEKLQQTKQKLAQVENPAQDIEEFKRDLLDTRQELRDVRRELNREIELVEVWVKFFTIGFIPLLIIMGGMFAWAFGARKRIANNKLIF